MKLYKSNTEHTDAESMRNISLSVNDVRCFMVRNECFDDVLSTVPDPIILLGKVQPEFVPVFPQQPLVEGRDGFHFFVSQRQARVYRSW